MPWAIRTATAAVLAIAVAALPLVLDRCAASCEARHDRVESTPSCHHTSSTALHVGRVPAPCGHDHGGIVVSAAASAAARVRTLGSVAASFAVPPITTPLSRRVVLNHAPPGSSLTLDTRSLPLRI